MTIQETSQERETSPELQRYATYVADILQIEDPDEIRSAMRFRVWNGDFDGEVDRIGAPIILKELDLDPNIIYRSLE